MPEEIRSTPRAFLHRAEVQTTPTYHFGGDPVSKSAEVLHVLKCLSTIARFWLAPYAASWEADDAANGLSDSA